MSEIITYVVVNADDEHVSVEHDYLDDARNDAQDRGEGHAVVALTYVYDDSELVWAPNGETEWPPPTATCPCGATDHVLASHPTAEVYGFTPTMGDYVMDDPIAEHRDGEHDAHPDPDSCAACAALGDDERNHA